MELSSGTDNSESEIGTSTEGKVDTGPEQLLTKEKLLACFKPGKFAPAHLSDPAYANIFQQEGRAPMNLSEKHQYMYGDLIIELYGKYKNYYKKTFNPQQISSPFAASQIIEDDQKRAWIYIDENDSFQGPFTTIEMDYWYNSELFPLDLFVGLIDRRMCIRLSEFINSTYPFDKNPEIYHVRRQPPSAVLSVGVDKKNSK